jgi:hypothetical protein
MAEVSIRKLSIPDLDEAGLRRLVAHGETLFVERKEAIPGKGLGPPVASFANTLGGWLLLGVADEGRIVGFDPGEGDFTDKMRHLLRAEIDPLPPFASTVISVEGKKIGVIRVFESADTPHVLTKTGAIPVREPGGTRNVRDRSELIDLARRGEGARHEASDRIRSLPYAQARVSEVPIAQKMPMRQVIVRLSPLTRSEDFPDRVLSTPFGTCALETASAIFPGPPGPVDRRLTDLSFGQRGFTVTALQFGCHHRSRVIADAGGVLVASLEYPRAPPPENIHLRPETIEEDLHTLFGGLAALSDKLGSHGRAVCDLLFRGFGGIEFVHQRAGIGAIPSDEVHVSGEITVPPDDGEIEAVSRRFGNEVARSAGLEVWQELRP